MSWSGWEDLGGIITEGPAVSSWAANRLDCFVKGGNNHLYHKWWNGSNWSGWEDLGGQFDDAPAAVSWGNNRIDCFVRGLDNALWHKWWNGSSWSGWESLGGNITSAPAAASWAANRLDVFARGLNNHMWHKWWNGAWSGWEDLGGVIDGAPAAVSWGPNRIDCFAKGMDSAMWHKWWNGSVWSGWESLGGVLTSAPAVSSWAANRLDCFVRGTDSHMWHKWWAGAGWSGWEDLGGIINDAPAAVSWGNNRIDCFVRGTDNHMWHKWWALVPTVRLHIKVLSNPTSFTINQMVAGMQQVYAACGIPVQVGSTENLNLPLLNDLDVGACVMGQTTAEQNQLFANRNNVGVNEVAVYFVRSTVPAFNGCAAHPPNLPSCVVASVASRWTLGHEVGHVLGLGHVAPTDRLMMGGGTWNITNPPPDLINTECNTMKASAFTIDI